MGARARRLAAENEALRADRLYRDLQQARLSSLYDALPAGCLLLDAAGVVIELNNTAARMLGASKSALLGMPLAARVAEGDKLAFALHLQATFTGAVKRSCDVIFGDAEGSPAFVGHLESIATKDARGRMFLCAALLDAGVLEPSADVADERLRHERELVLEVEASRRRFDRVAAVASLLAESLDVAGAAACAARVAVPELAAFCAVDLVDERGHVRRAAACSSATVPEDLPLDPYAPRGSATVVRTGRPEIVAASSPADILALAADPAHLPALFRYVGAYLCLPLQAHGRTLGAMSLVRPGRQAFAASDVALALEIARHAGLVLDNARLYRDTKEGDERKDEFLAMLGHELRNPLAAIVMAAARLKLAAAGTSGEKAVGVIDRQSQRMARLIDDLLDVSRVSRGKITLQRGRVVLGDVISKAVESVRPLMQERGHTLVVNPPEEPVILDADHARLEQVFVNLLANAAHYTGPGGRITVDAARDGDDVVVRVRDTGIGLAPEMVERIFDPFLRVSDVQSAGYSGLGIGLTLVRALVELHGGRISATSAGLGKGSEFVVRLPAPREAKALAPQVAPAAIAAPPRRRVLLVEDEADIGEMMRARLAGLNQDVRLATEGGAAVAEALAFRPEILLVDLSLPGMSGYDVVRRLRAEATLARSTFVAVTGFGDEATRRRTAEAGFDRHFTKPIADDALAALLRGG